ncbi:MAG: hypothetical protein ACLQL2_09080 [Methylovirgula sp.]
MRIYRITFAALAGLLACSTAQSALAGSYLTSGTVSYSFSTPQVSLFASVQVGGNPQAAVVQESTNNYVVIGQAGYEPTASVGQSGSKNVAVITQLSTAGPGVTEIFGSNQIAILGQ